MLARIAMAAAALIAVPPAGPASAAETPLTLAGVVSGGSGCPQDVTSTLDSDGTLTVTYPGLTARAGNGATLPEQRRNCQVNVQVNAPAGYTWTIDGAEYGGTTDLTSGATALQQATYYWSDGSSNTVLPHSFGGPRTGPFVTTDSATDLAPVGTTECSGTAALNVNAQVRVTGTASATVGSARLHLVAVPCS